MESIIDCVNTLKNALCIKGRIVGNEEKIAKGLLACVPRTLNRLQKLKYFPDVVAAMWRNEEVMKHLEKIVLTPDTVVRIYQLVEWTEEEKREMSEAMWKIVSKRKD